MQKSQISNNVLPFALSWAVIFRQKKGALCEPPSLIVFLICSQCYAGRIRLAIVDVHCYFKTETQVCIAWCFPFHREPPEVIRIVASLIK